MIAKTQRAPRNARKICLRTAFLALALTSACSGIENASKATERLAFRANFKQAPLVAHNVASNRVLRMHIFTGSAGQMPRTSNEVRFIASLK